MFLETISNEPLLSRIFINTDKYYNFFFSRQLLQEKSNRGYFFKSCLGLVRFHIYHPYPYQMLNMIEEKMERIMERK